MQPVKPLTSQFPLCQLKGCFPCEKEIEHSSVYPEAVSPMGRGVSLWRRSDSTAILQAIAEHLPTDSLPVGTHPMAIASERRLRESSHGETADGDRIFPWWDSECMAREPSHGKIARDSGVHQWQILVVTSNRACSRAAKHRVSVQRHSEGGTE